MDYPSIIKGMELSVEGIAYDMQQQFGQPNLRCKVCGHSQFGTWNYLKTGWPKHHGQTMRLETGPGRE